VAGYAVPRRRRSFRGLIVLALILLIIGAGVVFFVRAAQATTTAPATLNVFAPTVEQKHGGGVYADATSGHLVAPGDSVRTGPAGRAAVVFYDGSLTRLAPSTEITLTAADINKNGTLKNVSLTEQIGRTLTTVQHLGSGATFNVTGRSTTAVVRGTEFEVLVLADGTVVIRLFDGVLTFAGQTLTAGQQATVDPSGKITKGPIQPDTQDPFLIQRQGEAAARAGGTQPGTVSTTPSEANLAAGQSAHQTAYFAGGGDLIVVLTYPGSKMGLKVKAPDGKLYQTAGPPPQVITVTGGPAGGYDLEVDSIDVPPGGEPYAITTSERFPCQSAHLDQNGAVREAMTAQEIIDSVHVAGLSISSLTIEGSSSGGAVIAASGSWNGLGASGTAIIYLSGKDLGVRLVEVTVGGLSVPSGQVQQAAESAGVSLENLGLGYSVDRVFSCPNTLVIEGHR